MYARRGRFLFRREFWRGRVQPLQGGFCCSGGRDPPLLAREGFPFPPSPPSLPQRALFRKMYGTETRRFSVALRPPLPPAMYARRGRFCSGGSFGAGEFSLYKGDFAVRGKGPPSAGARGVFPSPRAPHPSPSALYLERCAGRRREGFPSLSVPRYRPRCMLVAGGFCSGGEVFERFGREEGARRQRGRGKTFFLLAFFLLKK